MISTRVPGLALRLGQLSFDDTSRASFVRFLKISDVATNAEIFRWSRAQDKGPLRRYPTATVHTAYTCLCCPIILACVVGSFEQGISSNTGSRDDREAHSSPTSTQSCSIFFQAPREPHRFIGGSRPRPHLECSRLFAVESGRNLERWARKQGLDQ